jgi:hypothetical protein
LILTTLLRREDVADDREQHAGDDAGADALQPAKDNQLAHTVERQERQRAGGTA